ncbi:MAG: hypothetical protein E7616_08085 [Ruminococcaceae bacterium]|nr:hypothetical protein [Oscillospiraceae bacterium]
MRVQLDAWNIFWFSYTGHSIILFFVGPILGFKWAYQKKWKKMIITAAIVYAPPILFMLSDILGIGTPLLSLSYVALLLWSAIFILPGILLRKRKEKKASRKLHKQMAERETG